VLNATGTEEKDKQGFLSALQSEKNQTFAQSKLDIIVGIQRVMEGTDWPVRSAVDCVGMPGSLNTVAQLLGRAMRPKEILLAHPHRQPAALEGKGRCGCSTLVA
jgi:superfamily II DNA or RNA helicase